MLGKARARAKIGQRSLLLLLLEATCNCGGSAATAAAVLRVVTGAPARRLRRDRRRQVHNFTSCRCRPLCPLLTPVSGFPRAATVYKLKGSGFRSLLRKKFSHQPGLNSMPGGHRRSASRPAAAAPIAPASPSDASYQMPGPEIPFSDHSATDIAAGICRTTSGFEASALIWSRSDLLGGRAILRATPSQFRADVMSAIPNLPGEHQSAAVNYVRAQIQAQFQRDNQSVDKDLMDLWFPRSPQPPPNVSNFQSLSQVHGGGTFKNAHESG